MDFSSTQTLVMVTEYKGLSTLVIFLGFFSGVAVFLFISSAGNYEAKCSNSWSLKCVVLSRNGAGLTSLKGNSKQSCHFTVLLKGKLTLDHRSSRLDPRVMKLERFKFRDARIESRDARINSRASMIEDWEARFSERMMLYSHIAIHVFAPSISACGAAFCNCLNCQGSASFQ